MSPEWGLFVDESGWFANPDDHVLGAGILLRLDVATISAKAIERELHKVMPDFPWPLHAAHVNFPVTAPLARCAQLRYPGPADPRRPPDPFDGIATGVVETLEREHAVLVRGVLDDLRRRKRPSYGDIKALDHALKTVDPTIHRTLDDYARRATSWILALIARLTNPQDADLLAATVLSGEGTRGDAIPPNAKGRAADTARYFTLLQCLLGRTYDLLGRVPGHHEVAVHVANRPIVDPHRGNMLFNRTHLRELIRQTAPPGAARVRLHAASTPDYGASVDARLVLADFVANRARRRVSQSYGLRELEEHLASITIGTLQSGEPRLSHVAASGWAREHIEAARRDGPAPPSPPRGHVKRWARDQATEWADALRPRP